MTPKLTKSQEELKKQLTEEQYHICVEGGTEAPFSGEYVDLKDDGQYHCVVCDTPLFSSTTKFESGTGWPSFYDVIQSGNVTLQEDNSNFMKRIEVICSNCGAHMGHVFDDGPQDKTGKRYCINSRALKFHKK